MKKICAICGNKIEGFGNNPWPVRTDIDAECCNECNGKYVIAARVATMSTPRDRIIEIANKLNSKTRDELDLILL